jgi:hypothetical protein
LVRADDGAIEKRANVVYLDLKLFEDALPDSPSCPTGEAVVNGLPGAIPVGDISPRRTRLYAPHHRIEKVAVTALGWRTRGAREKGTNFVPLGICELVAVHRQR